MTRSGKPSTLVVYNLMQHPLRSTIRDHLYAFRRYGTGRTYYLNLAVRDVPRWVAEADFDTVVFHTSFLSQRWIPELFTDQLERASALRKLGRARIALPQDEFLRSGMLSDFVNDWEIDHVLSVAPESEWPKIYGRVDRRRTRISLTLTGFLSDATVSRIERIVARTVERPVDVGYRAWAGAPWLGRHGMLKRRIGEVFAEAAPAEGLVADISMDDADVLNGDDWFRFLASCKYTIGVEGGATILDEEGKFKERTDAYLAEHPNAGFDEIEQNCFPGEDGKLRLLAISPRHLEACATRTCQVLVEGEYSGVLAPNRHYIELKRDLSNVDEVLDLMKSDEVRDRLIENAYHDVVASGRWTYRGFVREVERAADQVRRETGPGRAPGAARHLLAGASDWLSWRRVAVTLRPRPRLRRLLIRLLPTRALSALRRRLYGSETVAENAAASDPE